MEQEKEVSFFLHLMPTGKGRPRGGWAGNKIVMRTPEKTELAERTILQAVHDFMLTKKFTKPYDGALECEILVYYPRNKTSPNRIYPTIKPDFDNVAKLVCDSLNKLIYDDDCAIVDGIVRKRYVSDSQPHVGMHVRIKQLLSKEENENKKRKQKAS